MNMFNHVSRKLLYNDMHLITSMRVSFASQLLYETANIQLTVSLAIYLFIYSFVYNSFISVFLAIFVYKCVISWYHILRIYKYNHKTDIYGLFIEHIYIYIWVDHQLKLTAARAPAPGSACHSHLHPGRSPNPLGSPSTKKAPKIPQKSGVNRNKHVDLTWFNQTNSGIYQPKYVFSIKEEAWTGFTKHQKWWFHPIKLGLKQQKWGDCHRETTGRLN